MFGKNILLLEPGYKNKYPPLGLMKLAAYHRNRGDRLRFAKGEDVSVLREAWDRIYVTTLFSFEWDRTSKAIDFAIRAAGNQPERVFVGGIAASLMHNEFVKEPKWAGVRFIAGLLDRAPARALRLSVDEGDFGADDITGTPIEEHVPDYDILEDIDYTYPVNDAYFGYASRGCIRKCHFCGVPKLEGMQKEMPPLSNLVEGVDAKYGPKKDLILMDNNITASSRYKEIIAEIRDLGFTSGSRLERDGKRLKRRVDFNQGVDARILVKSPMYLREMATICISPLRIAFDHIGIRKVYSMAVRMAADNGITSLSNYMLYNFMDTPEDLYNRMKLNIKLNAELGIRIWSFPMRYQPVTLKDRSHIGKRWNRYYLRSFQVMLQATHGVVSGSETFFNHAYGSNQEEFKRLLSLPHGFIFHREHYEKGAGRSVREEYEVLRNRMSSSQEDELLGYLASCFGGEKARGRQYARIAGTSKVDSLVRQAILFHTLGTKNESMVTSSERVSSMFPPVNQGFLLPSEEEIVEDSGLYERDDAIEKKETSKEPESPSISETICGT